MTSFTAKIIDKDGGQIRFIKTTEKGEQCWCYLKVDMTLWPEYKKALKADVMDIRDYGEVLESGWGEYPPASGVTRMKEQHGFDTPKRNQA